MMCRSCGNLQAHRIRITKDGEWCDKCGGIGSVSHPDVYFREPYVDHHLIDPMKREQKDGVFISSKQQKAEIMRKLGVREAGDRKHGARNFDRAMADGAARQTGWWKEGSV